MRHDFLLVHEGEAMRCIVGVFRNCETDPEEVRRRTARLLHVAVSDLTIMEERIRRNRLTPAELAEMHRRFANFEQLDDTDETEDDPAAADTYRHLRNANQELPMELVATVEGHFARVHAQLGNDQDEDCTSLDELEGDFF
jgi:hypothetical protein